MIVFVMRIMTLPYSAFSKMPKLGIKIYLSES